MLFLRPRTIRGRLIAGLVLLEAALFVVFAALTVREHYADARERATRRFEYQVSVLASDAALSIADNRPDRLDKTMSLMRRSPTILYAAVTDPEGRTLASTDSWPVGTVQLSAAERQQMPLLHGFMTFQGAAKKREAAGPVVVDERVLGYVWIYPNDQADRKTLRSLLLLNFFSMLAASAGCTLLATLMARSITGPLKIILDATRKLVQHPEDTSGFPLALESSTEASDLARGMNLMVASIHEQRAGLNDTLALLDSMLANAPVGFAFFDRKCKLVRINQFMAQMNGMPISMHLGRTPGELLPAHTAQTMQRGIEAVFESGEPVRNLELNVDGPGAEGDGAALYQGAISWLANLYPVRTGTHSVRWVGAVIVDTTERKRSEEALRKTEKLAAAGRLAASIAHEINNPLEAVTNLLYLLRHHTKLDADGASYAELAQHEVARVSEITQQTLRFYRQSTLPTRCNLGELVDSVLTLHQGRVNTLQVEVRRQYRAQVELCCFAGELRQLFANLVGNALDAMSPAGGRLTVRVRASRSWRGPTMGGVRISVADTGTGMEERVRRRIFEPFFTTKEVTGTGLGLWVSAEIIQKHHGEVRLRSRTSAKAVGGAAGTVFMIFFPDDAIAGPGTQQPTQTK